MAATAASVFHGFTNRSRLSRGKSTNSSAGVQAESSESPVASSVISALWQDIGDGYSCSWCSKSVKKHLVSAFLSMLLMNVDDAYGDDGWW